MQFQIDNYIARWNFKFVGPLICTTFAIHCVRMPRIRSPYVLCQCSRCAQFEVYHPDQGIVVPGSFVKPGTRSAHYCRRFIPQKSVQPPESVRRNFPDPAQRNLPDSPPPGSNQSPPSRCQAGDESLNSLVTEHTADGTRQRTKVEQQKDSVSEENTKGLYINCG